MALPTSASTTLAPQQPVFSAKRQVATVGIAVVYGACLMNGVDNGVAFVRRDDDFSIASMPWLAVVTAGLATILSAMLAGYLGRRQRTVIAASAIELLASFGLLAFVYRQNEIPIWLMIGSGALAFVLAAVAGGRATALPIRATDLEKSRVLGIPWWHWLWLWLPWQYFIATLIWVGTPIGLVFPDRSTNWGTDIFKAIIAVAIVGFSFHKALSQLRFDSSGKWWQRGLWFVGWFAVAPILINLWRLLE